MEERYELRRQIGQGGFGKVHVAFDHRMKREVAVKRIMTGGKVLEEESTRQLMKEAGSLATLQHPNIVTVHDFGNDAEGPFVVMEYIVGKTLDDIIGTTLLTWPDFRELAMQTQEALVAAHELELVHSDIKPSNLMLNWLPSGKFQVKVVDFGLATLVRSQLREDLKLKEAVYGSIQFMPPEQFERLPLDTRSDMYSMGCVYYYALTGCHPFEGTTGEEVMQSHLQHAVTPLQHIRAGIPLWVCDWVMWHINRLPEDRPSSAREALSVFIQNERNPAATGMSTGEPPPVPKRPRLMIPGAPPPEPEPEPQIPRMRGVPQTLSPPEGSKPSVHTSSVETLPAEGAAPEVSAPPAEETPPAAPPPPSAAPPPALARRKLPEHVKAPPRPPEPEEGRETAAPAPSEAPRKQLSPSLLAGIAVALLLVVGFAAWLLIDKINQNKNAQLYNELVRAASVEGAEELGVDSRKLGLLLDAACDTSANKDRQVVYQALVLAKAGDGTDVGARILEEATSREMAPDVRDVLLGDVLRLRKEPGTVKPLLDYATAQASPPRHAVSALKAVASIADDSSLGSLLEIVSVHPKPELRKAAEDAAAAVIRREKIKSSAADALSSALDSAKDPAVRQALVRLLGGTGGSEALGVVREFYQNGDATDRIAAVAALASWTDAAAFPVLLEIVGAGEPRIRSSAFSAAVRWLESQEGREPVPNIRDEWGKLSEAARTPEEQRSVIKGLANASGDWVDGLLASYETSAEPMIGQLAAEARSYRKRMSGNK
jgi:serine/threonine protein kinase